MPPMLEKKPYPFEDWTIPFDQDMDRVAGDFQRMSDAPPEKRRGHEVNLLQSIAQLYSADFTRRETERRLFLAIRAMLLVQPVDAEDTPELEDVREAYLKWRGGLLDYRTFR